MYGHYGSSIGAGLPWFALGGCMLSFLQMMTSASAATVRSSGGRLAPTA